MHEIAVLALNGVSSFDLGIPCEVFGRLKVQGANVYRLRVCGESEEVRAGAFTIRAPWTLAALASADTIIVPGIDDPQLPVSDAVVHALRTAAARGARIASVCTGAFVLGAAGLLHGKRATTHWMVAADLAARHPSIVVDPNVLYIDEGQILTSAGAAAGLDLCLYMVRRDHGQAVAAQAARAAVAPLDREGGQAQFIEWEEPGSAESLAPTLVWMDRNAALPLTIEQISHEAGMSSRTLARRFKEQTGATPLQWLLATRVRKAREILETTQLPVDQVGQAVGFSTSAGFRERFRRTVGVSPGAYRRTFSGHA